MHDILHRVGSKWSIDVLVLLDAAAHRFNELRNMLPGVTQRSLSLTLHGLERDGLLERTVHPVIPPRVDYEITALGRSLVQSLAPVARWCASYGEEVRAARLSYDRRSVGGGPDRCGGQVEPADQEAGERRRPTR